MSLFFNTTRLIYNTILGKMNNIVRIFLVRLRKNKLFDSGIRFSFINRTVARILFFSNVYHKSILIVKHINPIKSDRHDKLPNQSRSKQSKRRSKYSIN